MRWDPLLQVLRRVVIHAGSTIGGLGVFLVARIIIAATGANVRQTSRDGARAITLFVAGIMIILICASRMYLGVHYPSDVIAGTTIGLACSAFCMATLEAIQRYSQRGAPEIQTDEMPAPEPPTRAASV